MRCLSVNDELIFEFRSTHLSHFLNHHLMQYFIELPPLYFSLYSLLCSMLYALCSLLSALCPLLYALCPLLLSFVLFFVVLFFLPFLFTFFLFGFFIFTAKKVIYYFYDSCRRFFMIFIIFSKYKTPWPI